MIEKMGYLALTNEYWDCECVKNYIHLSSQKKCPLCNAEYIDMPDSRVNEVIRDGFFYDTEESDEIIVKKRVLDWLRKTNKSIWSIGSQCIQLDDELHLNIDINSNNRAKVTVYWHTANHTHLTHSIEVL